MNTTPRHARELNDSTFLKLWNDLYYGVENNFVDNLLLEMAYLAGYSYCAKDLINMVKSAQSKPIVDNHETGNEIE